MLAPGQDSERCLRRLTGATLTEEAMWQGDPGRDRCRSVPAGLASAETSALSWDEWSLNTEEEQIL